MTHDRAAFFSIPALSPRSHAGLGPASLAAAIALLAATAPLSADVIEFAPTAPQTAGHFGDAVAGIPDINEDGVDDVIIGAPDEDYFGFNEMGRVSIYSGATGALIRTHLSPNAANGGNFGHAVAGIGDINADGDGDYIVGAPDETGPGGRIYVYSGATGTLLRTVVSPNAQGAGDFGYSIAAINDLNNDGRPDYIVGAPGEDAGATQGAGRVYVYSGATGALLRQQNSPNPQTYGGFGFSVTGVPDANGDGRGDYAVGAPGEQASGAPLYSGRAYAFNGQSGATLRTYVSPSPSNLGEFGKAVAGVPDINGDGGGDVLVGAPGEPNTLVRPTAISAGAVYAFPLVAGSSFATIRQPTESVSDYNQFGFAISAIPSFESDGTPGLLIGAPDDHRAYIFRGAAPFALKETLSSPDNLGLLQFWGGAVAGIRDANRDGRGDYIIGGRGSDNFPSGPSESGRAYLYRPVYNDGCGSIVTILPTLQQGYNQVSTLGAAEGGAENDCAVFADPGPDTWYRYTAPCTGQVLISMCSQFAVQVGFDAKLAVYQGCTYSGPFLSCNLSTLLGCSDNASSCGTGPRVTLDATAGSCYFVRLGGAGNASGTGLLLVTCTPSCPADLNGDGAVDASDLSTMLGAWGTAAGDVDNDGTTNASDIAVLLSAWGNCP